MYDVHARRQNVLSYLGTMIKGIFAMIDTYQPVAHKCELYILMQNKTFFHSYHKSMGHADRRSMFDGFYYNL